MVERLVVLDEKNRFIASGDGLKVAAMLYRFIHRTIHAKFLNVPSNVPSNVVPSNVPWNVPSNVPPNAAERSIERPIEHLIERPIEHPIERSVQGCDGLQACRVRDQGPRPPRQTARAPPLQLFFCYFWNAPSIILLLFLERPSSYSSVIFGTPLQLFFCYFWNAPPIILLFFFLERPILLLFLERQKCSQHNGCTLRTASPHCYRARWPI